MEMTLVMHMVGSQTTGYRAGAYRWMAVIGLLGATARRASAQCANTLVRADSMGVATATADGRRTPMTADSGAAPGRPAIILFAAASAGEVRFASQPEIRVRLCGGLDSIRVIDRKNLPSPIVTGTTYRNVYVAVQIFGRLNADCVTNAILGERQVPDSARAIGNVGTNCASVEVRGMVPTRPPPEQGRSPRR